MYTWCVSVTQTNYFSVCNPLILISQASTNISSLMSTMTAGIFYACLDERVSGVAFSSQDMLAALSSTNGVINKMDRLQLQLTLAKFGLDVNGHEWELSRRLKDFYQRRQVIEYHKMLPDTELMQYDYLVVIDFEATCAESSPDYLSEIIEFPAVLVDVKKQIVCSTFRSFCKPRINPVLTRFCTSLTGITQKQVDDATHFTDVLRSFEEWLSAQKLGSHYRFAIVTDGPYDMAKFFRTQLELNHLRLPCWAKEWINIRKVFTAFYSCGRVTLLRMLQQIGLQFQGRHHSGIDDAKNIARIVVRLLQDGCIFGVNEYFRMNT